MDGKRKEYITNESILIVQAIEKFEINIAGNDKIERCGAWHKI